MTLRKICTLTTKYSEETAEEISERMDFIYESNPHLSDNMYPDEKDHYYEFINTKRRG